MFARVLGPYLVAVTATALARTSDMRTLVSEFDAHPIWPWITGAFVLLSGLVIVALHPYWRGAAAIIVSALGWMTTLKGLFLLAIPHPYMSFASSALDAIAWWRTGFAVMAVVGLYLTFVGWAPVRITPPAQAHGSGQDHLRAA
jgi:hypothetical protein